MTTQPIAADPYADYVFADPSEDPRNWLADERCYRFLWLERADHRQVGCRCPNPYHGYAEWKAGWIKKNAGYTFSQAFALKAHDFVFPINPEALCHKAEALYTERTSERGLPAHRVSAAELESLRRGTTIIDRMLPTLVGSAKEDVLRVVETLNKALPIIELEGACALCVED